jgi:hypothetical protein
VSALQNQPPRCGRVCGSVCDASCSFQGPGSLAFTTAALDLAAGQLVTSERGVREEPLAFNSVHLVPHSASSQSLACTSTSVLDHLIKALGPLTSDGLLPALQPFLGHTVVSQHSPPAGAAPTQHNTSRPYSQGAIPLSKSKDPSHQSSWTAGCRLTNRVSCGDTSKVPPPPAWASLIQEPTHPKKWHPA